MIKNISKDYSLQLHIIRYLISKLFLTTRTTRSPNLKIIRISTSGKFSMRSNEERTLSNAHGASYSCPFPIARSRGNILEIVGATTNSPGINDYLSALTVKTVRGGSRCLHY